MKLFIIDGHALIFKMYYAFLGRPMVNTKGVDTSILFGFTKYLLELVSKEKPTHLAVSFDPPGGTFRNRMFPEYKANRGETPQLVIDALEPLTEICKALRIPVLMIPDYEADDVIGTLALKFASDELDVYMVTPDKDYGQLVRPHVYQYKPGKSGTDSEILGPMQICGKWNIDSTSQVIDILAICGDTADNVPGVQGVGPVGASKLLKKYGTLENILEHVSELTPKQMNCFLEAQDHVALSKQLVTIKTDVPMDEIPLEDLAYTAALTPHVRDLFARYEFNSLLRHLAPDTTQSEPQSPKNATDLSYEKSDTLTSKTLGVVLSDGIVYLADAGQVACGPAAQFKKILEDSKIAKYGFSMKTLISSLNAMGIELRGKLYDSELMHYLIDPEKPHQLDTLARTYLGVELAGDSVPRTASLFGDDEDQGPARDPGAEAIALRALGEALKAELTKGVQMQLYDRIEEPLLGVLSRMETAGVKMDVASLRDFADSLRVRTASLEKDVRDLAGVPELNVSSPKQIGEVLFEKLKLDPARKKPTKGSWPTDEATLVEYREKNPIIDAILDYRGTRKLLSTYIEPFPSYIREDGRIHTSFNQTLTSTGRLSSSNPNLQNIPIRTEQGREIRKAFVAGSPDSVMMSADYSQIELRLMAHLCGDKHMIDAFNSGIDIHSATAAKIFGIPVDEVTSDQRRVAKTANFGIMYGISAFGLAQRLKCTREEAKKIIDDYFESFPSIRGFIDSTIASARACGYVQTLFGRRRYVPDVNAHNAQIRALAERNAVNAPIQGTAADIIKLAMIGVDRRLRQMGLKSRMVLQIHDELVLEVPLKEVEEVREILVGEMESVMKLSVPLTVECKYGKNWLEAH